MYVNYYYTLNIIKRRPGAHKPREIKRDREKFGFDRGYLAYVGIFLNRFSFMG